MFRDEFITVAKGSNERTAIYGSRDYGTTGGHVDTANRRMISHYGLEDCCGFMHQVTCEHDMNGSNNWDYSTVYDASVDPQRYGNAYGNIRRIKVGYTFNNGGNCGSRSVAANAACATVREDISTRGCSDPKIP
jgi:hypothetical protein